MLWRVSTTEKKIYLTFDDGPHPDVTPWVLDQLSVYNSKAVFFCVGENVQRYPDLYQRILDEGHLTGNHTFNHLNGWNTHSATYLRNVAACARLVKSTLFRPPYGRIKKTQAARLGKTFQIVMWDVLSGDFDKNTTPEKCLEQTIRNTREGSVVVFHDSIKAKHNLQYALPGYMEAMKKAGFLFERLGDR